MTILGPCPNCGVEDSLLVINGGAACGNCRRIWTDWHYAVEVSGRNGARLIPVSVLTTKTSVGLELPAFVSCEGLVEEVLRHALITNFHLHGCENRGVAGVMRMGGGFLPVRFYGRTDMLGIGDNQLFHDNDASQEVLVWYAKMLAILFRDELVVDGWSYGRGKILRLAREDPFYEEKTKFLLWLTLSLTRERKGERFATRVLARAGASKLLPARERKFLAIDLHTTNCGR